MTDLCVLGSSQVSGPRLRLSRRDFALGTLGGVAVVLSTGCTSTAVAVPTPSPGRAGAVGARIAQAGFGISGQWRFETLDSSDLIAFLPSSETISLSRGAQALCENDGQLGALYAYMLARYQSAEGQVAQMAVLTQRNDNILSKPTSSASVAALIAKADVAALGALARAGYDPRDGFMIWQRIGRVGGDGALSLATRLSTMAAELSKMGYRI